MQGAFRLLFINDDALLAHLANPALGVYLKTHAELGTDFYVEFYGTVGEKVFEAMNEQEVHIRSSKQN